MQSKVSYRIQVMAAIWRGTWLAWLCLGSVGDGDNQDEEVLRDEYVDHPREVDLVRTIDDVTKELS